MSRKEPTPPPEGIVKPKPPPGPPGPHWLQRADRSQPPHSVNKDASDVITAEIPRELVVLMVSECLRGAIHRFHGAHGSDPSIKKGP